MIVKSIQTRIFREGEPLLPFINRYIKKLNDKSILVVTSKIVSLSEGNVREIKNSRTRENLIKAESEFAMRTKYTWLTVKDGMVMSSAGVDESNANGKIVLLPRDSFKTAGMLRLDLMKRHRIKNLGIIITDSRLLPLRAGVVGVALGWSGFSGVRDYRGKPDIFGRILRLSRTDLADSLATAAVAVMGEGAEQQPLALITGAPVEFRKNTDRNELSIDIKEDIYQPLFEKIKKLKLPKKHAGNRN
ncbi:coenzyme F420-0:L-glutamate ligase [Patescibacteria group bacterium]|nr:coenzyme F420-0:L-glutamate ligase [Patescibacteria group bacterium]MCL5114500.1 coenzyme F420-0:L-glutamate ligase [Patescibacteria group bacterium]